MGFIVTQPSSSASDGTAEEDVVTAEPKPDELKAGGRFGKDARTCVSDDLGAPAPLLLLLLLPWPLPPALFLTAATGLGGRACALPPELPTLTQPASLGESGSTGAREADERAT